MRTIEQNAARSLMTGKHSGQHVAGRSANVNDGLESRKSICSCDGRRFLIVEADHCLAKQRCLFWMMCEIFEEWHTMRFVKAWLARLNRVFHIIPSTALPGTP